MRLSRGVAAEDGVVVDGTLVVVSVSIKELQMDLLQMEEFFPESRVSRLWQVKVMGGWVRRSLGTIPLIV